MGFVNERAEDGKRRTVDNDRGAVLICIERGQPEKPYVFILKHLNQEIKFYAECTLEQTPAKTQKVTWKVTDIMFSNAKIQNSSEFAKIIQEGLIEYGLSGRKDHIESVNVTFPKFCM